MPVLYLPIFIDKKDFNRILNFAKRNHGANSNLQINNEIHFYIEKLTEPIEFARLKYGEYYMDITVKSFHIKNESLIIIFDKLIDYNYSRFIS